MDITLKIWNQCGQFSGYRYETVDIDEYEFISDFVSEYEDEDFKEWFELFLINQMLTEDFSDYLNLEIEEPTEDDILNHIYTWEQFKEFLQNHTSIVEEVADYIKDDQDFFNNYYGYLVV